MNKSIRLTLCSLSAVVAVGIYQPVAAQIGTATPIPSSTAAMPAMGTVSEMDKMFFMKAAQSGMLEVKAGEVAQKRASSDEVKSFATMMVNDHSEANTKLKSLAMQHKVMLPATLDAEHAAKLKKLQNTKKGKSFDMAYVDAMVMGHEMTVALFEKASSSATAPDVKAFATETLPTLNQHLTMIKEIKGKMAP